jgi:hypothetical protein
MCPTHHTVIDDDEDSYTVERLHKLKAEHEAKAIPLSDEEVERVSSIIVHKPFHNVGQTGGLAANTINAGNIQVYGAPNVEPLMRQRQVAAVDTLWKIIKALRDEFSDIVFVDTIYTQEEINDYFARVDGRPISLNLHIYRGRNAFAAKFERAGEPQAEAERPYISHELWQVFFIIRAVHGRMAFLIEKSFGEESYQDWRSDIGIDQQLRAVLPPETVQHLKSLTSHGLQSVFDTLEQYFLVQARMRG